MPVKHSTFDDSWVMPFYFNIDTKEGIALHQFDLPGYPASHGCVRLLKEDAVWFYSWGEQWLWRKDTLKAHAKRLGYKGVVTATSGNYGAAVASQAAMQGLKCIVVQECFDSRMIFLAEFTMLKIL